MQYKQKGGIYPLNEIKAGYLLVVENERTGKSCNMTVLPGNRGYFEGELACTDREGGDYWPIECFNNKTLTTSTGIRIKAIYGVTCNSFLLACSTDERDLLWTREEEAQKMTVKEICDALGYDVEIVKEKEPEK